MARGPAFSGKRSGHINNSSEPFPRHGFLAEFPSVVSRGDLPSRDLLGSSHHLTWPFFRKAAINLGAFAVQTLQNKKEDLTKLCKLSVICFKNLL